MNYILVDDEEKLGALLEELSEASIFAYDTETNAKGRFEVQLVGASFAMDEEKAYYVPLLHHEGEQLPFAETMSQLKPFFESEEKEKICHNAKYDQMVLWHHDIDVKGFEHDTFVMSWLLSEQMQKGTKGLKPLVEKYFNHKMTTYEEVVDSNTKRGTKKDYNFAKVSLDEALDYAAADAYWCYKLFFLFKEKLLNEKLWKPYKHIEAPVNRVIGNMENRGITLDEKAIDYAAEKFPKIMEGIEAEIYEQAGEVFNIQAPAQLSRVLFEKLKLGKGKRVPKTKTGQYKTDKAVLEKLAPQHEIVANILRRKKIQKTYSTFVEGTRKFATRDGKIHPRFNSTGTVTGRLSGSKPNMQQIEADEVEEIKVRNFFVPMEGHRFVVADYSQIELRVIAHFSKDKNMAEAFNSGTDFHSETAKLMFDVDNATRKQRVAAKTINFGIAYGRQAQGVAAQLKITKSEAEDYINNWFSRFYGVKRYIDHVHSMARKQGYIRTLSGRKRRLLPEIRSDIFWMRMRAERQAFNTKIQGSAADIIKMAMISLEKELKPLGGAIVIQIHDELVVEIPEQNAEESVATIKQTMENPLNGKNPITLPLITEPAIVDKWGEAK